MTRTTLISATICILALGVSARAGELYVPDDYNTIQAAVDAARGGDTVIVADGIYTGEGNRDIVVAKTITIRSESGPENCIIDCNRNGGGFKFVSAEDSDSLIDGFTITNAHASGTWVDSPGAAIYCNQASPAIANCTITASSAAAFTGGIRCIAASPTISNCTITVSTAYFGGAVYCRQSSPTITDCTIVGNSARDGGGIFCERQSSPTFANCTISGNSADDWGGAISSTDAFLTITDCSLVDNSAATGGAVFCSSADLTIGNCTFTGNSAVVSGGAVEIIESSPEITNCIFNNNQAGSGGAVSSYKSNSTISNCTITSNSAAHAGGGISCANSISTINSCTISQNNAGWWGGGIFCANGTPTILGCGITANSADYAGGIFCELGGPTILNCIISNNHADQAGGGIYSHDSEASFFNCIISGNTADVRGAGIYSWEGSGLVVKNCTFTGNGAALAGGAVRCYESDPIIKDSILWNNSPDQLAALYASPRVLYCDIQEDWSGIGDINLDPSFVQPGHWDADNLWVEGNYRLLPNSPCIDAGNPNYLPGPSETDLDGNPRVINGRIDMGAYETVDVDVPPLACIVGADRTVEAQSNCEATVTLDGSCSEDLDSTPGTNDDINDFDWYLVDACDPNFEDYLGSGQIIECNLGLGENVIVLEVTDKTGAFDTNEAIITVKDAAPPELTLSVTPDVLWPPKGKMVLVTPTWQVIDNCDDSPDVSLVSVTMNLDDGDITDYVRIGDDGYIYLRARRGKGKNMRVYTITYEAVDNSGNIAVESATVSVVNDRRKTPTMRKAINQAQPARPLRRNNKPTINLEREEK